MIQKIYIKDKIGEQYREWHSEGVIIASGTDTGKTTFIIETLIPYAQLEGKSVLYLVNRKSLYEQIKLRITEHGNVKLLTYQGLQSLIRKEANITHYDYIIADECHYFLTDGLFNQYTDIAYNWLRSQTENVVIYMSATGNNLFNGLMLSGIVQPNRYYSIPQTYENVESVYFYEKKQITRVIDNILLNNPEDKILVFVNSIKRLKEMYCNYGDKADYLCSRYNYEGKSLSWINYNCVQNCQYEKRILFCTKAMDNGIDLKDSRIKHVLCEIIDIDSAIQAIGRKRPENEDDTYNLYFLKYNNRAIAKFKQNEETDLLPVIKLMSDKDAFMQEYRHDRDLLRRNKILYGELSGGNELGSIHINHIIRQKYEYDVQIFSEMMREGHDTVLLKLLGRGLKAKVQILEIKQADNDKFLEYLKANEGKKMFKEEQKVLKEKFKVLLGLKDRFMGINTLNGKLKDCKYPFEIQSFKETKGENRFKRYWLIVPFGSGQC